MRTTFSGSAIHQHDTNVSRLTALKDKMLAKEQRKARKALEKERKALAKEQKINEECRSATSYKESLRILVREALKQYRRGHEAKARIPLYAHDVCLNAYDQSRGVDYSRFTREASEKLNEELSEILRTLVDCKFELSVEIGYEEGGERGEESEPTKVSLTLFPS